MRRFKVSALAAVAGLGLSLTAQAQTPPAPPPPPGGPADHGWNPAAMREHREARRAARIRDLHDILAITPEQEGAFQAFAASMATEAHPGPGGWGKDGEARPPAPRARPTTPERLDLMLKRFDERTSRMREAMARHAAAVKALYAALSPRQQRTMDALPALLGGEAGGREGWGGREGGPPPTGAGD